MTQDLMNFGSWLGTGWWFILLMIYEIVSDGQFGHPKAHIT